MNKICFHCENLFATEDCHQEGNALFNFIGIVLNEPVICPDCWSELNLERHYREAMKGGKE